MAVFKKGDWVLMTEDDGAGGYESGDVFRLTRVSESGVYFTDKDGDKRFATHHAGRFEPWTPKVGERVRFVRDNTAGGRVFGAAGEIATAKQDAATYPDGARIFVGYLHRGDTKFLIVANVYDIEPVIDEPPPVAEQPAPLTIQAGKFYKTRDGRKVGPMEMSEWGGYRDRSRSVTSQCWSGTGTFIEGCTSNLDLISEWVDTPGAQPSTTNTAATVDAINDEYGPVVAVADVPKFKVGDIVEFRNGYANDRYSGRKAKVIALNVWGSDGIQINMSGEVSTEHEKDLVPAEKTERTMIRTPNGYGFELARVGDYVWVDVGQKVPITVRADNIRAA